MEVVMTIEDPKALTKPWVVTKQFRKLPIGTRLYDYGCAENNRKPVDDKSVKTILFGPDGKPLPAESEAAPQKKKNPLQKVFGIFGGKKKDSDKQKPPEKGESP